MAWIYLGALPCRLRNLMTARVSILLKSRASLTCFRDCILPGRAKDLSAPGTRWLEINFQLWLHVIKIMFTKHTAQGQHTKSFNVYANSESIPLVTHKSNLVCYSTQKHDTNVLQTPSRCLFGYTCITSRFSYNGTTLFVDGLSVSVLRSV